MTSMEDFGNRNERKEPKSNEEITQELQTIQRELSELEGLYPDIDDEIQSLVSRINQHQEAIARLDSIAQEKFESGEVPESTAGIVATSIEETIRMMEDLSNRKQILAEAKRDLDVIISQLTLTRSALLRAIR